MIRTPRGIAPELLVSQVRNTMPYLFDAEAPSHAALPPVATVRGFADGATLSHFEYFDLCLSCHYLTCATPVPTDVDNQIRSKLWPEGLPLATALEMGRLVLSSHGWDFTLVSHRVSPGARGTEWEHASLHGHFGEWFTVASAAYAALRRYRAADAKALRAELFQAIAAETERHANVFGSLWRGGDGVGALKAAASIAHNFGDLDRVMDMWALPIEDPLRLRFHKLTATPFDPEGTLRFQGRLWAAGELYKSDIAGSSMALENHRHFALRKPRALRSLPSLRVPLGPFFDGWGAEVAQRLEGEALREVALALADGWERAPKTFGYARGLRGIFEAHPALRDDERLAELWRTARVRAVLEPSREAFEAGWASAALAWLEEIPSRA